MISQRTHAKTMMLFAFHSSFGFRHSSFIFVRPSRLRAFVVKDPNDV
ncbi:hypothetical protein PLANPX_0102 [Lacipirellula parvula]|uniref:Uncharacterized protein n=1 Tax=Lacipirellula parvula TaxID=2650471 RepID=A0A5K7X1Z1_9BACT|nr:hypothetical protein PLANPX_0102 [Lacipirellula parvula]